MGAINGILMGVYAVVKEGLYYLWSENKSANQLHSRSWPFFSHMDFFHITQLIMYVLLHLDPRTVFIINNHEFKLSD